MEIIWLDEIGSTQTFLIDGIKSKTLKPNIAVGTDNQVDGKGRRGDSWEFYKGSLALSVAIKKDNLPKDMPLSATAIFAGYILFELMSSLGSNCWLKWPNDLYIDDKKLAGIIAMQVKDVTIFGIGLNNQKSSNNFAASDVLFEPKELAERYVKSLLKSYNWDLVFREIEIKFNNNLCRLKKHYGLLHSNIELCSDGSLTIDERKVYTLT